MEDSIERSSLYHSTPIKKAIDSSKISTSTPEKPIQRSTRKQNRRVALSLKEVKKVALGLQSGSSKQIFEKSDGKEEKDLLLGENVKKSRAKTPAKLIEKYEILAEFFNSMESSIRLLKLKGSPSNFPNVSASIQNLTGRRFTYGHLAQLKHIFSEAIIIKKVNLLDVVTSCMKPDLHVSFELDAIQDTIKGKRESGYSLLRRIFRERLVDFSKRHPEGDDIPEEQLPYPFTQSNPSIITEIESKLSSSMPQIVSSSSCSISSSMPQIVSSNSNSTLSTMPPIVSNSNNQPGFGASSHMPRSFKSRFSQKIILPKAEKTPLLCHDNLFPEASHSLEQSAAKPLLKSKAFLGCPILSPSSRTSETHEDANKKAVNFDNISKNDLNTLEGTPVKLLSTPARLMTNTPESQTPKRHLISMDCDITPVKKTARRSTKTKLFTTPKKNEERIDIENEEQSSSGANDILGILPEHLLRSVRAKERKAMEDKVAGVPEAKRRQKLIAFLPSTFDVILLMFQSGNRSVITKQELVHKIVASHRKIVDGDEVEEQLKLLREIVPDWIFEKMASTGDILYSVEKLSSVEELRQRLANAK